MKMRLSSRRRQRATTLIVVLVLSACTMVILGGVLSWTTTNTTLSARNNEYFRTVAAAEAATEKVISAITHDYQTAGDLPVRNNVSNYKLKYPTASENAVWGNYQFSDGAGNGNRTWVEYIPPSEFRVLNAQYRGLFGYSSIFRVISNARDKTSRYNLTAGVWQDVETATIPLFQFAIFYNIDLEINPGPNMTVLGPVHSNQRIYVRPGATLTFEDDVTAAAEIFNNRKPGDPSSSGSGTLTFNGEKDSGVSSLNLPIGIDNSPAAVRQVIEVPPVGESPTSALGAQRLYNKADLVVTLTDGGTSIKSGRVNNFTSTINLAGVPANQNWLSTSTLYNRREAKTVQTVEINVGHLVNWNASTNNTLPYRAGSSSRDVTIIHVDDKRSISAASGNQPGVVVKNGALLPPSGLTVVTPEPLYVHDHYNVKNTAASAPLYGSHNTAATKPAALMGDAITILSGLWLLPDTTYGSKAFGSRLAQSTTVNAAILAGIVETVSGQYSGGVENFPRFLENWSGDSLTYNGSMAVMFPSQTATGLWQGTGSSIGIYNPPTRDWAFDLNFRDPAKIPPGTPSVRVLIRGAWAMVKPGTTDIVNPNELVP